MSKITNQQLQMQEFSLDENLSRGLDFEIFSRQNDDGTYHIYMRTLDKECICYFYAETRNQVDELCLFLRGKRQDLSCTEMGETFFEAVVSSIKNDPTRIKNIPQSIYMSNLINKDGLTLSEAILNGYKSSVSLSLSTFKPGEDLTEFYTEVESTLAMFNETFTRWQTAKEQQTQDEKDLAEQRSRVMGLFDQFEEKPEGGSATDGFEDEEENGLI